MAMLQQMAGNDPLIGQAIKMAQNGDPREVVNNLAKTRGIDMSQLQQMASQLGLKL